jgi:hypothetical protein
MACATWVPEVSDVVISTTGSLDSSFADMAREMLTDAIEYIRSTKLHITYIFEICHPSDPHIIPENLGAYLIGYRWVNSTTPYFTSLVKEAQLDQLASDMKVSRPSYFEAPFIEIAKLSKGVKHEGFMVYGQHTSTVLKLKSPYYLALKAIARKQDILSLNKHRVSEEYYPLLDHLKSLGDTFQNLSEQDRLAYIRNYLET